MNPELDIELSIRTVAGDDVFMVSFLTERSVHVMHAFNDDVVLPVLGKRPTRDERVIAFPVEGSASTVRRRFKAMSKLFANGGLAVGQIIDTESRYHVSCLKGCNRSYTDVAKWNSGEISEQQFTASLDKANVPQYWIYV